MIGHESEIVIGAGEPATGAHPNSIARAVDIANLTISYRRRGRRFRVVSDLSLHIKPGEAYGLVGESGCGKTTVAMALMRYLPPNAIVEGGHILVGGEDLLTLSETRLRAWRGNRMAMVYQDPGSSLNPSMRVGAQVAEVYRLHRGLGRGEALNAAEVMLEKVQITDPRRVMHRYPHQLSGGQQQRIVIAMALATDPDLLVLDEPTTGLDATVEAGVLDLVEQLRDEFDASILFISHNLGVVGRMCERVGVLYAGRLIEEGTARDIFAAPRHPYTLALMRCVPRLGMRKDSMRLDPIPGSLPPLGAEIPGCVYADRCPIARDRCRVDPPPLYSTNGAHVAACHFHDEVPDIPPSAESAPAVVERTGGSVLLKVDELVKTYRSAADEVAAVAGVSFEVARGETFGLVGESGCGKSSLAKVLVGLVDSTSGSIEFEGNDVSSTAQRASRDLRRKVQMVFQNPDTALNPRHSVRRILGRALKLLAGIRPGRAQQERMVQLASSVRLEPRHLEIRPAALSGGLKQRVAIARAFAGTPRLVICDEPVSALDVSVQAAILNLLVDLQIQQDVSYVFISHDLALVRYLADRIGVMYLGQLVDIGTAAAVFEPPHHPYTEALASAIPTLDLEAPRRRIKLEGTLPSPADPPTGCRFHTRCPRCLGEICRTQEPPWRGDPAGNMYRCHIPPNELREIQLAAIETPVAHTTRRP
jgi:peptide/nickel transport system ATP-binding protein